MTSVKKIVLANATIANGNMGCVALCISMLNIIDSIFSDKGINYILYLTHSGYSKGINNCKYILPNKELHYTTCQIKGGLTGIKAMKDFILRIVNKDAKDSYKILKNVDYIIDIGQGDSFSDIYGDERFRGIDRIHRVARKLGKPYCLLPQTIGPFRKNVNKRSADESISKASLCMARDKLSYDYVVHNVPNQKSIFECIDVAFNLPYEKISHDSSYFNVGLNVSSLLWHGGYTGNNQFEIKIDYNRFSHLIIDFFLSQRNTKVHLVPHVVDQARGIENDYEVCYNLWREYGSPNLVIAPFALGPVEIKSYIAGLDFFVGSRMHSTIAAFSSFVPVVPIAYSRKFNGLFIDTLEYPYLVDLKSMTIEESLNCIIQAYSNRSELAHIITERMNGVVQERINLINLELEHFLGL